jgi:lipid-binding SYLF domain-containing protein
MNHSGAEVTDYVIVLNNDDAVSAFSSGSQVSFGASVDISMGPLGR